MSNELESIVRPAQTLDYSPARVVYNPGQIGVPNTTLRIGMGGSGKVLSGSFSFTSSNYMTQYANEKKTADFGTAGGD